MIELQSLSDYEVLVNSSNSIRFSDKYLFINEKFNSVFWRGELHVIFIFNDRR